MASLVDEKEYCKTLLVDDGSRSIFATRPTPRHGPPRTSSPRENPTQASPPHDTPIWTSSKSGLRNRPIVDLVWKNKRRDNNPSPPCGDKVRSCTDDLNASGGSYLDQKLMGPPSANLNPSVFKDKEDVTSSQKKSRA